MQIILGYPNSSLDSAGFQCLIHRAIDGTTAGFWVQGYSRWLRDLTNTLLPPGA